MADSTDNTILYYDFVGRLGYLAKLFECKGAYICQKIRSITIPSKMLELELFRTSLKVMFVWKCCLVSLDNKITVANLNKEKAYLLADIGSSISPCRSSLRNVQPAQVYLSPSRELVPCLSRNKNNLISVLTLVFSPYSIK